MAKYSYEFKKKIVEAYLNDEGVYKYLADKYYIPSFNNIKKWVRAYQANGDEGLCCSRKQKNYSFEYKLDVVELCLSSGVSYQDLASQEKINNPAQICKWVNDFQITGCDALKPKKKRRKKALDI